MTIDLLLLQLIRIDHLFLSIYYRFSDLFSLSDCRIGITLAHLVSFTICTGGPLLSSFGCLLGWIVHWEFLYINRHWIIWFLTRLVYLSLVLNKSFSYVSFVYSITYISIIYFPYYDQITPMYPSGQIIICTNGYLEDLTIYLLFLAHLSYLFFWLNESLTFYCLLSVLTLLVCLDTVPNECISPDNRIHI